MIVSTSVSILLLLSCSLTPLINVMELRTRFTLYLSISGVQEFSRGGEVGTEDCMGVFTCSKLMCEKKEEYKPFIQHSCEDGKEDYFKRVQSWIRYDYTEYDRYLTILLSICVTYPCILLLSVLIFSCLRTYIGPLKLKVYCIVSGIISICLQISVCAISFSSRSSLEKLSPEFSLFVYDDLDYSTYWIEATTVTQTVVIVLSILYTLVFYTDPGISEFVPLIMEKNRPVKRDTEQDYTEDVYPRQEIDPIFISIEGNMSTGKSTMIRYLQAELEERGMSCIVISEPIDKWMKNGISQAFQEDEERWAYSMQTFAYITRINKSIEAVDMDNLKDVYILERSWFSDEIFAKMLYDTGKLTEMEFEMCQSWSEMWKKIVPFVPNNFVYLRCSVEESYKRMKGTINIDYLHTALDYHDRFFSGTHVNVHNCHIPCYTVDTSQDYINNTELRKEKIDDLIYHVLN